MSEERSNEGHLSVVRTTTREEVTQQHSSAGTVTASSSSHSVDFYFQIAVIIIGFVGTAANALILYALIASKQLKKHVLIVNQNALDLASSFLLIVTYAMKLCNIPLFGSTGYWLCIMLLSENILWWPITGSIINLISITVERYLMVVHPSWSKNKWRNKLIYFAAAFAWFGGTVSTFVMVVQTTDVKHGVCYSVVFWKSHSAQMAYGIWYFLSFYVIVLMSFIICYGRILLAIRRQARVMAGHVHSTAGSTTAQTLSNQIQTNVIKTMIIVSAVFAITWMPVEIYYLLMNISHSANLTLLHNGYYAVIFISFLYICINPFIYAIKFPSVRGVLVNLISCNKTSGSAVETIDIAATSAPTARVHQTRASKI